MRLWLLLAGLLILGLASPVYMTIAGSVAPSYSDTTSQIIIYAVPAVLVIMFVFMTLFWDGNQ